MFRVFYGGASMTSEIQTIAALLVVAIAAAWLVRHALVKRQQPGCGGGDCGAVSPDAQALLKKLRKR
jgi:hypothetical protein